MSQDAEQFAVSLRAELRHRLRPMVGRNPFERGRATTPLELLYDLTYVIAFGAAAEQLARAVGEGHVGSGLGAYLFAIFTVSWAWMNFTWFSSAYDNDDAFFRVATLVQMLGVIILIFGLPASFEATAEGHSPNNLTMVIGYVVMRIPLIALWLRAAHDDPRHRRLAIVRVITISLAQVGWLLTTIIPGPVWLTIAALVALALAEMIIPVVAERRLGTIPWNAGHVAERYGLLTLIVLGEVIAATVQAVGSLTAEQGWPLAAVVIMLSGLVLATGFWWAYFLVPSRIVLERWPQRTFLWRYANLPIFGSIAAVGAGLRVTAEAVERQDLSIFQIALALAIPTGVMILMIFLLWSVLMRSFDAVHLPLFALSIAPLGAAVIVGWVVGRSSPLQLDRPGDTEGLVTVIALVALCPVVEVIAHEMVGYGHTLRVIERQLAR